MNRNYKLSDFKRMEEETDIDFGDVFISMDVGNLLKLPSVIKKRIEEVANKLIAEYEQRHNTVLPIETLELGGCVEIRKESGELALEIYIGCASILECLCGEDLIKTDDGNYAIIRKFFFDRLNDYISEEIKKLEECLRKNETQKAKL